MSLSTVLVLGIVDLVGRANVYDILSELHRLEVYPSQKAVQMMMLRCYRHGLFRRVRIGKTGYLYSLTDKGRKRLAYYAKSLKTPAKTMTYPEIPKTERTFDQTMKCLKDWAEFLQAMRAQAEPGLALLMPMLLKIDRRLSILGIVVTQMTDNAHEQEISPKMLQEIRNEVHGLKQSVKELVEKMKEERLEREKDVRLEKTMRIQREGLEKLRAMREETNEAIARIGAEKKAGASSLELAIRKGIRDGLATAFLYLIRREHWKLALTDPLTNQFISAPDEVALMKPQEQRILQQLLPASSQLAAMTLEEKTIQFINDMVTLEG